MPELADIRRYSTRRAELRRPQPRRFTRRARTRFDADLRRFYLSRIEGEPTPRQATAIDMLCRSEWAAALAEHEAETAEDPRTRTEAMRVASDARKAILLWTRELTAATPPPPPAERPDALTAILDHIAGRRGEAA